MRTALLVVIVAIATAILWFAAGGRADLAPSSAVDPSIAASIAPATETVGGAADAVASVDLRQAATPDATATDQAPPPMPDDYEWVELQVVDRATQEPVAGAAVSWAAFPVVLERMEQRQDEDGKAILRRNGADLDHEALARDHGWSARTDDQGRARIRVGQSAWVCARHGARYGEAEYQANRVPVRDLRIAIAPDGVLRVRVSTAAGEPADAVPVELVALTDGIPPRVDLRAESAADGSAVFAHVQVRTSARAAVHRVRTALPGFDDPGVEFDPLAPSAEPIELRLGGCGSVLVAIDLGGGRRQRASIRLSDQAGPAGKSVRADVGADGWARFPRVPTGLRGQLQAHVDRTELRREFVGPVRDGDEVRVELTLDPSIAVVSGCAVDDRGQPFGDTTLAFTFTIGTGRTGGRTRTHPDGTFAYPAGPVPKPMHVDAIELRIEPGDRLPGSRTLGPLELKGGINDLGQLAFARVPVVVAGHLVRRGLDRLPLLQLRVQRWGAKDGGAEDWHDVYGLGQFVTDDRFGIGGATEPGRHRLAVSVTGALPIAPIEFAVGAEDVEVVVDAGHRLRARVRLPERVMDAIELVARRADGQQAPAGDRGRPTPWTGRAYGPGVAVISGLPAGTYSLDALRAGDPTPLRTVDGIELPAAAGGEAPIVELDLCPLLQFVRLRFAGVGGAPLVPWHQGFVFEQPPPDPAVWQGHRAWVTGCPLLLPAGPRDLLVAVDGYRPQLLRGVDGNRVVELQPWGEQQVVVADLPAPPPGTELRLSLQPLAPASTARFRESIGELESACADVLTPAGVSTPLANGSMRVPVADGEHRVRVELCPKGGFGGRRIPLDGVEPATFVPGPQPIVLRVDAAALQRAVQESLRPRKN